MSLLNFRRHKVFVIPIPARQAIYHANMCQIQPLKAITFLNTDAITKRHKLLWYLCLPLGFTVHSESCHNFSVNLISTQPLYPTSFLIYMHMYATESASQRRSSRSRTTRRTFVADRLTGTPTGPSHAILGTNQPTNLPTHSSQS